MSTTTTEYRQIFIHYPGHFVAICRAGRLRIHRRVSRASLARLGALLNAGNSFTCVRRNDFAMAYSYVEVR